MVTLLVPVLGGLFLRRPGTREALAAIGAGVTALFVARFVLAGVIRWIDPTLTGILAAAAAYVLVLAFRRESDPV